MGDKSKIEWIGFARREDLIEAIAKVWVGSGNEYYGYDNPDAWDVLKDTPSGIEDELRAAEKVLQFIEVLLDGREHNDMPERANG